MKKIKIAKHAFRDMIPEKLQEIFDSYLLSNWSYSGVSCFARNEKAFEKENIYREWSKKSASTNAGSAYHSALDAYFSAKKEKKNFDLVDTQRVAYEYIDGISTNAWKLQKKTPSVEECIKKTIKLVTYLLESFFGEIEVYDDIVEILAVEIKTDEFLTINGVDIPLPCHARIDLVCKTKDGKIVVIDHKSVTKYTDEKDVQYCYGKQGIIYTLSYEILSKYKVDEFWICENKSSKNKDGSPQLRMHKIIMDSDTRALYELQLYEPLKRMLEAIGDPDYVYLINESDNFIDRAELYEFWCKTQIAELDEFNIPEDKKELIGKRLKKIRDASCGIISPKAIRTFQANASAFITYDLSNKNMSNSDKVQHRLKTFGIPAQVAHTLEGYSSDTYLLEIQAGTSFSSVYKHRLDIANALGVESVRMDQNLFVYKGKSYFVVESSKKREKDLVFDASYQKDQKIPVGVNNFGETVYWDLANPSTTNALVCGACGSGKSVWLLSTIEYAKLCGVEEFVIFDPKFEFTDYEDQDGFEVYNNINECESKMEDLVNDMQKRVKNKKKKMTMIIFDEFADAVQQSTKGESLKTYEEQVIGEYANGRPKYKRVHTDTKKTLEENMKMILQKGRSSGYRIIAATQRASIKVITGDAKVNFPVQICFRVPKAIDSQVVLGEDGAESLAGQGDGLFRSPEYPNLVRFQGFCV